jgi:hypothetical protein
MQFLAVLEACVDDLDMASLLQTAQPDDIARQFYDLDRPEDQYGSDVCRDRGIIARVFFTRWTVVVVNRIFSA